MKAGKCMVIALAALGWIISAPASVVIQMVETNGNVEVTMTGSLDFSGLTGTGVGGISGYGGVGPSYGEVSFNDTSANNLSYDTVGTVTFGSGGWTSFDSATNSGFFRLGSRSVTVRADYVNGSSLAAFGVINGKTLADIGADVGTYTWTLSGKPSETITLEVIPEPATGMLVAFFAGGFLVIRRIFRM